MPVLRTAGLRPDGTDVATTCLVTTALPHALGTIMRIDVRPGASGAWRSLVRGEHAVVVVAGGGTLGPEPLEVGSTLHVRGDGSEGVRAGRDGVSLLVVAAAAAGAADGDAGERTAEVVHLRDRENLTVHAPERGFFDMETRWLVTRQATGSRAVVVGQSAFAVGGRHELHRHADHAVEFFYLLEGEGAHIGETGDVPMHPGDMGFITPGEWHGFRNVGQTRVRAIFGYLGAGQLEEAGYELPR